MNPFSMPVLKLEGTSRQIGRAHGEELRQRIGDLLAARTEGFAAATGMTLEAFIESMFQETRFYQAAERWVPHLLEEVRGLAEGAGQDFCTMFAWQLLDETDWFLSRKTNQQMGSDMGQCSALGAFGPLADPVIIAQNADMGKAVDGLGVLLHLVNTETGLQTLAVTIPGVIGIYGMNNRPVGVCLNAMGMRLNKSTHGLGTVLIARGIMSQPSFEAAAAFITAVPHASGEAYTVGGRGAAAVFEGSANQVCRFNPPDDASLVYHTNHPLANTDIDLTPEKEQRLPPEFQSLLARGQMDTETRLDSVQRRMQALEQPLSVARAREILSTHDSPQYPVCKHKDDRPESQVMTNFSMIMVFSDPPEFHVASGPPCQTEFRTFRFTELAS